MISALFFVFTFLTTITLAIRQSAVYLFVLYQAYYFFNPETKWWSSYIPDLRYSFYIVLTMLIVTILNWGNLKGNKILVIPQFRFMYFTAFLYTLASLYAVLPGVHAVALDAILTVTVLVTIVYKLVRTEKHLDIIMVGYVIFAGYMGYYVAQFGRVSGGRFDGAGMVDSPDANGVGAALAPALIICAYYFWANINLKSRLLFGVLGMYITIALVQIGSRGAFLGVAFGAGVFICILFFSKLQRRHQKKGVIVLIFVGLIGVGVVTDSQFWDRMGSIKTENIDVAAEKESGSTRFYFWMASIDMAKDYPFGAGASGFVYYSPFYIPESVDTGGSRNRAVHSTWFEVLSEIGYLGLFSFVGMIFYSFSTIVKTAKKLKNEKNIEQYFKVVSIGCALFCFIISMTFLNRFRAEILYWLILFSAVAYNVFYIKFSDTTYIGEK